MKSQQPRTKKPNPDYKPEPARAIKVNGVPCVNVDGGRYADAARDFGHRPVKVLK